MTRPTVVTGGAGFIGSHLVEHLAGHGHQVRVIERPGAAVDHLPAGVEVCFADIRDEAAVRRGIAGAETVFHLAANPNLWARDRGEFEAVNHRGTVHVLDAAIAAGAHRIVHCSTESILTCARPGAGAIAEDVVVEESDAVGPYCLSKLRAEKEAMARARAGHPVYVANPTMPIGPGDRGLSPPTRLLLDCATGRLPALLDCTLNIVDVRLAALGLARIPEAGRPGRRYLLGGENLTLVSFLGMVAEVAGATLPSWRVPYTVALAYAHLSEWWSDHVSGKPPQANVTGVRLTRRTMHFDSSRSLAELGLVAPPVREAVEAALAWLAGRGLLTRSNAPTDPEPSPSSA